MKKILFVIQIVLTWYLAAMYRLDALMTAAVMEAVVFLSMMICVRYMKRKIDISFWQSHMIMNRMEDIECPFLITNKGVLPISRIRIRFSYIYDGETERKYITFSGNIDRNRKDKVQVRFPVLWCGKLLVRMEKMELFDYFSLFKVRTKPKADMIIVVLPPDRRLCPFTMTERDTAVYLQNEASLRGNGSGDEFIQVREYAQGDHYRYIHWKLSARTEMLLVREYQEAEKKSVVVYLDFCRYDEKNIGEISVFFELLWALVSGLFEEGLSVRIDWKNRDGVWISRITETGDARHAGHSLETVFEELYEKNWSTESQDMRRYEENERVFRLGVDLKLAYREEELFRFTTEHYEDELEIAGTAV